MRAWRLRPGEGPIERAMGSILASDARTPAGRVVLRKGTRLGAEHAEALSALGAELHLVELGPGELEQDEVARRLARAIAGPGTAVDEPSQGQARVRATRRGLLRVRAAAVRALNGLAPLLVFTLPSGRIVVEDDELAGTKSAALVTPSAILERAEALAGAAPLLEVVAFARLRVSVLVTDHLEARGRAMVAEAVRRKVEWFGSDLLGVSEVAHAVGSVREGLRAELARGAELLLVSGANPLDPLDPVFEGLAALGGRVERTGVPAHPGSMVWVASLPAARVLGIATCAGFGKNTSLDLLLAAVLAGEEPAAAADALGHGGLVEGPGATAAFPPYERAAPGRIAEPAQA